MNASTLLRSARRASGLSQSEYAATVGVTQPAISAYERGRREPTVPMLTRLIAGSGRTLRLDLVWSAGDLPRALGPEEHADRLAQVLGLADAIPRRRNETRLLMPRIDSSR